MKFTKRSCQTPLRVHGVVDLPRQGPVSKPQPGGKSEREDKSSGQLDSGKWQPVDSLTMGDGDDNFEMNMKYQQTRFVLNKLSDAISDAAKSGLQAQASDSAAISQPPHKKRK